jgi:hypothetical protein
MTKKAVELKHLSVLLALTTSAASVAGCSAEPDEPSGSSAQALLAGRRLSEEETAGHLRAAGFREETVGPMVCTAKYESSFYDRASNVNTNGSTDRGLFQINSIHLGGTAGCPRSAEALWDPATNARCAAGIFALQGIRAWYGYRAHRAECDAYPAPGPPAPPFEPTDRPKGGAFEALHVKVPAGDGLWITQCNESADAERVWQTTARGPDPDSRWAIAKWPQALAEDQQARRTRCGEPNQGIYPLVVRSLGAGSLSAWVTQCTASLDGVQYTFRTDGDVEGHPAAALVGVEPNEGCRP